jgi:proline iminopeptidase
METMSGDRRSQALQTFVTTDGRTLSYVRRGTGPLVVCVPGGPGMDPQAYFAGFDLPGYEVLIFGPRGVGDSAPPATLDGYRLAGYVADVNELRLHLGVPALTLYGHSHGGMVALAYASTHPARVSRFVVSSGPARLDEAYREACKELRIRFAELVADGAQRLAASDLAGEAMEAATDDAARRAAFRGLMSRYVVRLGPRETEYLDRLCLAPMNFDAVGVMYEEMAGGYSLTTNAGAVTASALVLGCDLDVTAPPAVMRQVAAAIPSARYAEFAGVGHFVEIEARDQWLATVLPFLAE